MTLLSVPDARKLLGYSESDTTNDSSVNFLLTEVEQAVKSLIGDIYAGNKTFELVYPYTHTQKYLTWNVSAVVSIDGNSYTGGQAEFGGLRNSQVYIPDIGSFIDNSKKFHSIVLTCGYTSDNAPGELKRLEMVLLKRLSRDIEMRNIESEKQGPRSVSFFESLKDDRSLGDARRTVEQYSHIEPV